MCVYMWFKYAACMHVQKAMIFYKHIFSKTTKYPGVRWNIFFKWS